MQTVLAVDDELSVRQAYRFILGKDYRVLAAESAEEALSILNDEHVDVILLDMVMPGMHGLEFMAELRRREETTPVIVITASNSVVTAVEAIKGGACEYLSKPFDVQQLSMVVERTLREHSARRELTLLRRASVQGFDAIVGNSPALLEALTQAHEAAQSDAPVLITGESGTGRSLLARAIHAGGRRADSAFASASCAGPAAKAEREILGCGGGVSSGVEGLLRIVDRGTLLLDEVGDLSATVQAEVFRVLQDGLFRPLDSAKLVRSQVRIVCSSRGNLEERIREGAFRADLHERLTAFCIAMPPLRHRRGDIPALVVHLVGQYGPRAGARTREFSPEALSSLAERPWPGNVRELRNVVQLVLMHHGNEEVIGPEHLGGDVSFDVRR